MSSCSFQRFMCGKRGLRRGLAATCTVPTQPSRLVSVCSRQLCLTANHASSAAGLAQVPVATYRSFDLAANISTSTNGSTASQQSLVFHPWTTALPDGASAAANGTAAVTWASTAGDGYGWVPTHRLMLLNASDQGAPVQSEGWVAAW